MQSIHYKSSQMYKVEIRITGWLNFKKVKEKGRQFCIKIKIVWHFSYVTMHVKWLFLSCGFVKH